MILLLLVRGNFYPSSFFHFLDSLLSLFSFFGCQFLFVHFIFSSEKYDIVQVLIQQKIDKLLDDSLSFNEVLYNKVSFVKPLFFVSPSPHSFSFFFLVRN